MPDFVKYDRVTGQIVSKGTCVPDDLLPLQADDNFNVLEGSHDQEKVYYNVALEEIASRPQMPVTIDKTEIISNEIDASTISGLPADTKVTVQGHGEWEVTDGEFILTVDLPGAYEVTCVKFPYQDKEFSINATEP